MYIGSRSFLHLGHFKGFDRFGGAVCSLCVGFGDNVVMFDDATGTSTNFTCTALIPKQGLAADTQFIEVVIGASPSDLTLTYKLPSAASFDSGKQYIYNLAVSMDELEVSCEIDNWNAAPADPEFTQIKTI